MDPAQTRRYQIKAAAQLTGLSSDTIRAWERRYGAIAPERVESKLRQYTDRDISRLILLRRGVEAGHSIGRIVGLDDEHLSVLLASSAPAAVPGPSELCDRVVDAIERFDFVAANQELAQAAALLPPRELVYRVVAPIIATVSERWSQARLGIAQEHLATSLLRGLIGTLLRLAPLRPDAPTILLSTLPGEQHELGLLLVALLAAAHGLKVCYLGPSVPPDQLLYAAERSHAAVLALSLVRLEDEAAAIAMLGDLARRLPPTTRLWIGGQAAAGLEGPWLPPGARRFATLPELEGGLAELLRLGSSRS